MADDDSMSDVRAARERVELALCELETLVQAVDSINPEQPPAWLSVMDWRALAIRTAWDQLAGALWGPGGRLTRYTSCYIHRAL